MKFKIIFWDNDGVLVNTEPAYFEATREVLKSVDIELTHEWYINEQLKKGISAFELANKKGLDQETIEKLRQKRNELYLKSIKKEVQVIDGVKITLENLYGKVPMGIVTTSRRSHLEKIMESTGLGKYFNFSICREDVTHEKPDPEPYLKAWEKSGFKKTECLVIEDTERGVTAAKAAGLSCFACPTEFSQTNDFSKADKVIKNVEEILSYFE